MLATFLKTCKFTKQDSSWWHRPWPLPAHALLHYHAWSQTGLEVKSLFSFEKILNIKPNRSDIDFEANQVRFQNSPNVLQKSGFLYNLVLPWTQPYFDGFNCAAHPCSKILRRPSSMVMWSICAKELVLITKVHKYKYKYNYGTSPNHDILANSIIICVLCNNPTTPGGRGTKIGSPASYSRWSPQRSQPWPQPWWHLQGGHRVEYIISSVRNTNTKLNKYKYKYTYGTLMTSARWAESRIHY